MKKQVPFIGEEFFARDGDNHAFSDETALLNELLQADHCSDSLDDKAHKNIPARPHKTKPSITVPASNKKKQVQVTRVDWHPINHGHGIRVSIHGDMDLKMINQWQQLLRETAGNGIHQFEIDLKNTDNMSLSGLAMLLLFKDQKKAGSGDISLNQCSRELYKRLIWSGLTEEFIIRPRQ
ncbi:STAS domain-containing protein [Gilvimarinus agarilyticus]|uniref:STAS domain-containing protein n=1 Tax=unclassified Gilvimarinus TaxID=2642066 RepID=UPI001C089079|nr:MULTISPECIES: STAS domain-containing protein [unclassified Gilvimarinus]MBU2887603.1 STAS domain-containing protein [Gilvimarinus agarilyticus]MDO6572254.1 STAS domain-containing protein [Gilvimarinus sp. 2_MG-2023]MDO6746821.1 STAS domain-containing protein [Gilvimarinus sp. 1_MG-2023]